MSRNIPEKYDLICVGGGIMSATLSLLLKLLDPKINILILERLDKVSQESSAAWNNSGTGHSAFCELNYTPENSAGKIEISKAIQIFKQFEQSKQFWSYLIDRNLIENPQDFIRTVPHHSWVVGKENVAFLKKRYEAMQASVAFQSMKYTEDPAIMKTWFPLIMSNRSANEPMAATRMEMGTEVNFGALTNLFFDILEKRFDTPVHTGHEVEDVDPSKETEWFVKVKNLHSGKNSHYDARHVFIGAGGGALPLLQTVEIPQKKGYGGFPVSGEWLVCNNRSIIEKHHAKVYSKAGLNAPPMSTPHLDTRHIDGKQELMFGPFAGFSTKFLKKGSYSDLFKSIKFSNLPAIWGVFWHNLPLTKYLIEQVRMDHADRIAELREFIRDAKPEDWELKVAGQRVQIIKRDEEEGGILEFGTDVVHSEDGSITALLGASPGASTAVHIMIEVMEEAFPEKFHNESWQNQLSLMVPFWNKEIPENEALFQQVQATCSQLLELEVAY